MCGIAGCFGPERVGENRIDDCLRLMRRRGPDHAAWWRTVTPAGDHLVMLHARLSIIDLDERANQPFHYGPSTVVFNGEVYNYLELRQSLAAAGACFRTDSDTEVLADLIGRQGWDALDRAEGMWAFAHYDETSGALTLCRDRFGEKPLYLLRHRGNLYFGSEAKFVFALAGHRAAVNLDQVRRYLVYGYKSLYKHGETFYEGLEELAPATTLRLDGREGELSRRYWTPGIAVEPEMSFEDAVRGVRLRVMRSMELRLRADVPLAFCMSGGIDSNALISAAKRVFGYDVHGFTITNTDARYEEQEMVNHAVAELGIRHTSIPVSTSGFLERLRELVRYHDAPVYTITYYAHWLLMEAIKSHGYRIAVSGTAADELFTGYYDHHLAYLREIRHDAVLHAASLRAWRELVQPLVRNPHLGDPDLFVNDPGFRGHITLGSERFGEWVAGSRQEPFRENAHTADLLRNRMLNELFVENVPVILHEDDLNAMYFSIENRSPFLDRDLFDFAYSIPTRHLVRAGRAKAVLREAMRGIVPDRILDNPRKVGFNAPIFSFLDVRQPEVRRQLLADSPIYDVVQKPRIERLLDEPGLANSESKFLFSFLVSKMFLEESAR
jgi:asparagine synthase (glutamine-hydrolysing)